MAALEATAYSIIQWRTLHNYQLLVAGLCFAAALLVGALIIALVNRWRKRSEPMEDFSPTTQLAQFRSLYEAGQISQEEFERLRAVLSGHKRDRPPMPPAPPPPPAADEPPTDNPDTGIRPA